MKTKKMLVVAVIIAAIGIGFIFKFSQGAKSDVVVFKSAAPVTVSGFEYSIPQISLITPSSVTFSNIKITELRKTIVKNGVKRIDKFYSVVCDVNLRLGNESKNFLFKGVTERYFKPGSGIKNYILDNPSPELISGTCYDPKTNKPDNRYDLLIAPDFSFASLVVNKSGKGFALNGFYQIANGKWIYVALPSAVNASEYDGEKFFFFENGISSDSFIRAAKEGPIVSFLKNKLGRSPTQSEIKDYIMEKLSNP